MNTNQQTAIQTQKLLARVIEYYRNSFKRSGGVQEQLVKRLGITDYQIFEQHKIGYCDGTLAKTIPSQGQAVDLLKSAGILDEKGIEMNTGCLVMLVIDAEGNCLKLLSVKLTDDFSLAAFEAFIQSADDANAEASPAKNKEEIQQAKDGLTIRLNNRAYLIRGMEQASAKKLRVNIKIICDGKFYLDSFDLYIAKARKVFAKEAATIFHQPLLVIEQDLLKILTLLEANIQDKNNEEKQVPVMTEKERNEALKFLKSPDLIKKILADFDTLGLCGENTNKLIGYLAAVSRKLDDPLSLLILSRSSAGKSTLQDAILELIPEEDREKYSRITSQALYYRGENSLYHKLIAIEEEEGASKASYSLRIMQSAKALTISMPVKDPLTGGLKTQENKVKGPVSIFLTTTRNDIDAETMSRFLVLTIDESKEQTQLIHKLQREKDTLAGLLREEDKEAVIRKHANAQRILKPLKVINPYADQLTFNEFQLRARRDHKKYLNLIKAITFLHQHQRPIKQVKHHDKMIEYIEVTLDDIKLANTLSREILSRSLDEASPMSRELLHLIKAMLTREAKSEGKAIFELPFSRRGIREYSQWGDYQLRVHLKQLLDLEYLIVKCGRNGVRFMYQLNYDPDAPNTANDPIGLIDCATLSPVRACDSRLAPPCESLAAGVKP